MRLGVLVRGLVRGTEQAVLMGSRFQTFYARLELGAYPINISFFLLIDLRSYPVTAPELPSPHCRSSAYPSCVHMTWTGNTQ